MEETAKDRRTPFWRFLYALARATVARRYNYKCEAVTTDGPCLIVSNHVTNSDPFLVGLSHGREPLTYVASEHIFRQGFISKLIVKLLDPIPRSKAASGADTVKSILRRIKKGESVVLFAEGDCTWDGLTAPVFPATGKLAKVCGVPLVTYRIEGGYLTRPRWSKKRRRGEMHGGPVRVYSPEELKAMTPAEATEAIDRDIFTDIWAEQRKKPVQYRSKAPAEGLERALFMCPECGGADCMRSKKDKLLCGKCGAEWRMDEYGFLKGPRFSTIAEWDAWQKKAVKDMKGGWLFAAKGVLSDLPEKEKSSTEIALDAGNGGLVFAGRRTCPFSEIDDMAMVKTNRLLFDDKEGYFEIKTKRGILRPYLLAWRAARGEKEE